MPPMQSTQRSVIVPLEKFLDTQIYQIARIGRGQLYAMPMPAWNNLEGDAAHYAKLGVNLVVSHLEPHEAIAMGLRDEAAVLAQFGLDFLPIPIQDRNLPTDEAAYFQHILALRDKLHEGVNIAVHCRAGIGRTGVTCCCLLMGEGHSGKDAVDWVRDARQCAIPDTEEQYDYIIAREAHTKSLVAEALA